MRTPLHLVAAIGAMASFTSAQKYHTSATFKLQVQCPDVPELDGKFLLSDLWRYGVHNLIIEPPPDMVVKPEELFLFNLNTTADNSDKVNGREGLLVWKNEAKVPPQPGDSMKLSFRRFEGDTVFSSNVLKPRLVFDFEPLDEAFDNIAFDDQNKLFIINHDWIWQYRKPGSGWYPVRKLYQWYICSNEHSFTNYGPNLVWVSGGEPVNFSTQWPKTGICAAVNVTRVFV